MSPASIAAVRRFHRLVTQRSGALEDSFLGRDRPLGQSRVLYEIGAGGATLRQLRTRIGLDSGYLSRVVHALVAAGLVELESGSEDERLRVARLTPAGLDERAEMERRADAVASSLLDPLSTRQRERLVDAMTEVHRLVRYAGVRIERVDPAGDEARACVDRYFEELGRRFPGGFDPGASLPADPAEMVPPRGVFLAASVDGEPVASGAVKWVDGSSGAIKRMWVDDALRGLGLGRRMLGALEDEARVLGLSRLRLETNHTLSEAIRLYTSAGYAEVPAFSDDPYAHHWFEKRLS